MARFAAVTPPQVLLDWPVEELGPWHLLLAHDVVAKPEIYKEAFKRLRAFRNDVFIFMDNSVVETGGSVDLQMVHEACMIVDASVACMPDVIGESLATSHLIGEAWTRWENLFTWKKPPRWDGFMLIPQGNNLKEFLDCAMGLPKNTLWGRWYGVPRWLADHDPMGGRVRALAAELLTAIEPRRNIHLLGFGEDIASDVISCRICRHIDSIDSAVPMRAATLGLTISPTTVLPRRGDWWEDAVFVPKMVDNHHTFSDWIIRDGW